MQDEVEVKARELLADAYDGYAHHFSARQIRAGGSLGLSTEMAIRAIAAALRQRPVVDDAMVEAVWSALDPGDVPGLTRRKLRAALLAAYQQDNGPQRPAD